jgi:hypothetical protein
MSADPAALQLRLLQTVVEVAAEKNSTLVMPVPVELLRFFDRAARNVAPAIAEALGAVESEPVASDAQHQASLPSVPVTPALAMSGAVPADVSLTAPVSAVTVNGRDAG